MKAAAELGALTCFQCSCTPVPVRTPPAASSRPGLRPAWATGRPTLQWIRDVATTAGPLQERASPWRFAVGLAGSDRLAPAHLEGSPSLRLAALGAGGSVTRLGRSPHRVDGDRRVARVAGEAFSMITGADLKYLDLNQDPPAHEPAEGEDEVRDP